MKKLKTYLRKNKMSAYMFSKSLAVTPPTVYNWLSKKTKPSIDDALTIERVTNGAITVYDWR